MLVSAPQSLGDVIFGSTLDFKFNTFTATGAPITLAGSPAVAVYEDNGTTEITAGVTLTVGFDAITGMHHVRIVLADAAYEKRKRYQVALTAGTVDGVSVVGRVIASFSIQASAEWMAIATKRDFNIVTGVKRLYAPDGSTVIETLTLSSSGTPVGSTITETPS